MIPRVIYPCSNGMTGEYVATCDAVIAELAKVFRVTEPELCWLLAVTSYRRRSLSAAITYELEKYGKYIELDVRYRAHDRLNFKKESA